mmetsp:Transcript_4963/g.20294  ORF Transcript_4963/g.20294 Transcript_4963/m.20294 type:complete len:355 (-) Transcript_4963:98-1162(-)
MLLGEPVDVCSKDTTDSSINYFETTRRSARSPYSPLNPLEVANPDYGAHSRSFSHLRCAQCDDDDDSRDRLLGGGATSKEPRTLGGSVPLARLALAVLASLALTAGVAITVGASHKRQLATLAALKATQTSALRSAERQQKQHPRLAQLAATTRTNAALLLEDRRSPSTSSSEEEATDSSSSDTPALGGVDVVAFFLDGMQLGDAPVVGTDTLYSNYRGFRYLFATVAHRDAFEDDPERFVPAWGAFCAWSVSEEYWKTDWPVGAFADPSAWAVVEDRLVFFLEQEARDAFLTAFFDEATAPQSQNGNVLDDLAPDMPTRLAKGDRRWGTIFGARSLVATGYPTCRCDGTDCPL